MTDATGVSILAPVTVSAPPKPGWKSSETWLAFLTQCLGAATATHLVGDGSPIVSIGGLVLTLIPAIMHTWSRTSVKVAAS